MQAWAPPQTSHKLLNSGVMLFYSIRRLHALETQYKWRERLERLHWLDEWHTWQVECRQKITR
jgi:hypothetical protein